MGSRKMYIIYMFGRLLIEIKGDFVALAAQAQFDQQPSRFTPSFAISLPVLIQNGDCLPKRG
jgi:hypothetical protein